jgi:hypothetical protein
MFSWKTYATDLKSVTYVALVRKAADKIRITMFFKPFRVRKIYELVVTNKLTNNFTGLVTSGLRPDEACGTSDGPC